MARMRLTCERRSCKGTLQRHRTCKIGQANLVLMGNHARMCDACILRPMGSRAYVGSVCYDSATSFFSSCSESVVDMMQLQDQSACNLANLANLVSNTRCVYTTKRECIYTRSREAVYVYICVARRGSKRRPLSRPFRDSTLVMTRLPQPTWVRDGNGLDKSLTT